MLRRTPSLRRKRALFGGLRVWMASAVDSAGTVAAGEDIDHSPGLNTFLPVVLPPTRVTFACLGNVASRCGLPQHHAVRQAILKSPARAATTSHSEVKRGNFAPKLAAAGLPTMQIVSKSRGPWHSQNNDRFWNCAFLLLTIVKSPDRIACSNRTA